MATYVKVCCPACGRAEAKKNGKTKLGKQRYCCNYNRCSKKTFIIDHTYNGCKPNTNTQIINMTLNGSGIRDIARVLGISITKVISTIKKKPAIY